LFHEGRTLKALSCAYAHLGTAFALMSAGTASGMTYE
jgi:hypothetical protein